MSKISKILTYLDNGPFEKVLSALFVGGAVTAGMTVFVQFMKNNAFLTDAGTEEIFNKLKSHAKVKQILGEPIEMLGAQVEDKVRKNFAVDKMQVSMELKGKERNGSFLFWLYMKKEQEDKQQQWLIKNAVMGVDDLPDHFIKIKIDEEINAKMTI